jgi:hypothetical protein
LTFPVTEPFYSTRYYKGAKTDETGSPGLEKLESVQFDISDAELVDAQAQAVRDIIAKCRRDGQRFLFLESPCYHRLQEDEQFKLYRKMYIDILDSEDAPYILADDVDFDAVMLNSLRIRITCRPPEEEPTQGNL